MSPIDKMRELKKKQELGCFCESGRKKPGFELLSEATAQKYQETLLPNYTLGKKVEELIAQNGNVKRISWEFFNEFEFYRDWKRDFGVDTAPLFNMNRAADAISAYEKIMACGVIKPSPEPEVVKKVVDEVRVGKLLGAETWAKLGSMEKETLGVCGGEFAEELGKRQKLRAFAAAMRDKLLAQMKRIGFSKRDAKSDDVKERIGRTESAINEELRLIDCDDALEREMEFHTGCSLYELKEHPEIFEIYADEIIQAFWNRFRKKGGPKEMLEGLSFLRGEGIEFAFARRDSGYLTLGDFFGDCSASNKDCQVDKNILNISWTIPAWILDRNYAILGVYIGGELVMKAHIIPLVYGDVVFLAVDGLETVPKFRDDLEANKSDRLLEIKDEIFDEFIKKVKQLAEEMGIGSIYIEQYSNTPWVRKKIGSFQSIYLNVKKVHKVDGMDDIYELASNLCGEEVDVAVEVQT